MIVGEVNKSEGEPNDFEEGQIDEVDKVVPSIGLFFVELIPQYSHLNQQNNRIDTLPSSSLEQVFVPRRYSIAICGHIMRE